MPRTSSPMLSISHVEGVGLVESEVVKMVVTQGVFAVLFVYLLFYVLKTTDKREAQSDAREIRLITALETLAQKFDIVDDIKEGLCRVEKKIDKL